MAKGIVNQDEITRRMLDKIRIYEHKSDAKRGMINEAKEENKEVEGDAIAITDDPKFGQNVLTNQIQMFRTSVESGAEFNKPNPNNVTESPLVYIPSKGNLIFSGVIPCLNNLKWQFVLKTNTGSGCFLWADGLILNKDNIQILNKLSGFYSNWREMWITESADLEMMANKMMND